MEINYQCSNCGKRFATRAMVGISQGIYYSGCRVVGDAFYCEDCVRTWIERNGKEFDEQYKDPKGMFAKWWNRTVDSQCVDKSRLKKCRQLANGDFVECQEEF